MNTQDIRWQQRFNNYKKALTQLHSAVLIAQQRELNPLEMQGIIQAFEFTHELAWNVLRDFLREKGNSNIMGSKDATREAFKVELINDGEQWMEMIRSRNLSSHTYNESTATKLVADILSSFYPLLNELKDVLEKHVQ